MDIFALPPLTLLLDGAYRALLALSHLFEPVAGTNAAALAVAAVTVVVRTLLIPVGISQAKAEQMRARLAPKLRDLQKRHAKDRERLQRETLALYKDENASPLAGCLPLIVQAAVVGVLYTLFLRTEIAGHPNELLTQDLFGAPLGDSLLTAVGGGLTLATGIVWAVVLVVILIVAEVTRRVFRPQVPEEGPLATPGMLGVLNALHYLTAVFAVFVPLAAALYLVVTVTWTLVQRALLRRRYPLPAPQ
ncbi:membrane protein insertase YidC [Microbacterium esteraromaticum]|uniref:YidC/Oxa1 family membrane protein insertase n=1 Tax=Microbacterium esteraromaticum TaxID=57043 RepID=UPI001C93B2B5|nr:membrane protein insertase YidC [Microbacterium esteraromaticum]MBY6061466.1 membrane protein insertase YidC [Microbacterium esteraromaticum]